MNTEELEEVKMSEEGFRHGLKLFRFRWLVPNPYYKKENPGTGKIGKSKWLKRTYSRGFVSRTGAEEWRVCQLRHLRRLREKEGIAEWKGESTL